MYIEQDAKLPIEKNIESSTNDAGKTGCLSTCRRMILDFYYSKCTQCIIFDYKNTWEKVKIKSDSYKCKILIHSLLNVNILKRLSQVSELPLCSMLDDSFELFVPRQGWPDHAAVWTW